MGLLRSVAWLGLVLPGTARAEPLAARWDSPRSVKINLFYFEPGPSPLGPDFTEPLLSQWTAVLSCSPLGRRTESCAFVDGVWFSYVNDASGATRNRKLAAPGTLELVWTERGRLSSWDVSGDRQAFWDAIGGVLLEASYRKPDVPLSANERREIGSGAEGFVARALAGALEWELPKKGDEQSWKIALAPTVTLRYEQSTSNSALTTTATSDPEGVRLVVTGSVSEATDQTQVKGSALFDTKLDRVISGRYETHVTSAHGVSGPTRSIALLEPWSEGQPTTPAAMPDPELTD